MKALLLLIVPLCLFGLAGCGDTDTDIVNIEVEIESGPTFQDAWLSSDAEGNNRVTSYGPSDTVHAKADLVHAKAGTEVEGKLIAVKVDHPQVAAETEIGAFKQTFDGTLNRMNFDFTNDGPMPSGSYRVDLSIAGADDTATSLSFTIPAQ